MKANKVTDSLSQCQGKFKYVENSEDHNKKLIERWFKEEDKFYKRINEASIYKLLDSYRPKIKPSIPISEFEDYIRKHMKKYF